MLRYELLEFYYKPFEVKFYTLGMFKLKYTHQPVHTYMRRFN